MGSKLDPLGFSSCSDVRMTQECLLNLDVHFVLPQQRGVCGETTYFNY